MPRPATNETLHFLDLAHGSPEFDAVYAVFSHDIPADFLEEKEFLRNRLRVRDQGPRTEKEKLLVQDGYTLHLIAAKEGSTVVGAIYGHLISRVGADNRGVGFITYIAVLKEQRRRGIGSNLLSQLRRRVEEDSLRLTGRPLAGMVYEIEIEGKDEIKRLVRKLNAWPLGIDYFQPALRETTAAEEMHLWFQPLDPPLCSVVQAGALTFPGQFVRSLVLNLLTMEYVGPEMKGFDRESKPYPELLGSLAGKTVIGFLAP